MDTTSFDTAIRDIQQVLKDKNIESDNFIEVICKDHEAKCLQDKEQEKKDNQEKVEQERYNLEILEQIKNNLEKLEQTKHDLKKLEQANLNRQMKDSQTYNSVITWNFGEYAYRKEQALARNTLSWFSTPSYMGINGYKYNAQLYLNGEGMCRTTHLSILVRLLPSSGDDALTWPMPSNKKITVRLVDFIDDTKSVERCMILNDKVFGFCKRPVPGKINMGIGIYDFISLEDLNSGNFIINDMIVLIITMMDY